MTAPLAPLVEQVCRVGGRPVVDILMHIMFGDTSLAEGGPVVEHWREVMADLRPSIGDSAHQVIHRESIVDELAGCSVPVLAVSGAQDHAYPPPISDENIARATGGTSHRVEDAGHSVALEQPDVVADLLLAHFAAGPRP